MNYSMHSFLDSFKNELNVRFEVHAVIRDIVDIIGSYDKNLQLERFQHKFSIAANLNTALIHQLDYLQQCCLAHAETAISVKARAHSTRRNFITDVGNFLAERQQINSTLQALKVENLQNKGSIPKGLFTLRDPENMEELPPTNAELSTATRSQPLMPRILLELDDSPLLHIFSFLRTEEVLNYAQVCRYVYRRIDGIFEIQSAIVQDDWGILKDDIVPEYEEKKIQTPKNNVTSGQFHIEQTASLQMDTKLSREMIEVLTKRLSAQELKVILGLAEKLKKQSTTIDTLTTERDDALARLESAESVKDFLADKLKSAELALKSIMVENGSLKKQIASDSEIICFLDLHVQDLESQLIDLNYRYNQSQTALNLQIGSHTMMEEQLATELRESQLKYEALDSNFKSQKKLLVKEVKTLRAQVESLILERSKHSARLQVLRDAINSEIRPQNTSQKLG